MVKNFMDWENPGKALITGSSAGIGLEFARQLASQGFDIILVARREERLKQIAQELEEKYSVQTEILVADLASIDKSKEIGEFIKNQENLDVLVCNAGYAVWNQFLYIDLEDHINMTNLMFTNPMILMYAALPNMIKRKRGVIINTSSNAATNKSPGAIYTSVKAALTVLSELLQGLVQGTGVKIQSLCPGFTYSEFHDQPKITKYGMRREQFPKEAWMEARDVVELSLKAVKTGGVMFLPSEYNVKNAKNARKNKVDDYLNLKILY